MVRWHTIYEYMEQKEQNEQIIKVLSFILGKLDTLEIEQSKHKEMFYKVRKNLTDANDLINQILDVLEIENPELYSKTMEQYQNGHVKDLVSTLDKHIAELDDLKDLTSTKGFGPLEDAKRTMEDLNNSLNAQDNAELDFEDDGIDGGSSAPAPAPKKGKTSS